MEFIVRGARDYASRFAKTVECAQIGGAPLGYCLRCTLAGLVSNVGRRLYSNSDEYEQVPATRTNLGEKRAAGGLSAERYGYAGAAYGNINCTRPRKHQTSALVSRTLRG
jgi:hypothetical protein